MLSPLSKEKRTKESGVALRQAQDRNEMEKSSRHNQEQLFWASFAGHGVEEDATKGGGRSIEDEMLGSSTMYGCEALRCVFEFQRAEAMDIEIDACLRLEHPPKNEEFSPTNETIPFHSALIASTSPMLAQAAAAIYPEALPIREYLQTRGLGKDKAANISSCTIRIFLHYCATRRIDWWQEGKGDRERRKKRLAPRPSFYPSLPLCRCGSCNEQYIRQTLKDLSSPGVLNISHLYHQLRLTGADGKEKEKEGKVGEEENDDDGMATMNFSSHHLCTPLADHSPILWTIRSASPHSSPSPFLYPPTWSRPNVGIKLIGDASTVPCIIWAHHCILTSRCPYFAALLSTKRAMSDLSCALQSKYDDREREANESVRAKTSEQESDDRVKTEDKKDVDRDTKPLMIEVDLEKGIIFCLLHYIYSGCLHEAFLHEDGIHNDVRNATESETLSHGVGGAFFDGRRTLSARWVQSKGRGEREEKEEIGTSDDEAREKREEGKVDRMLQDRDENKTFIHELHGGDKGNEGEKSEEMQRVVKLVKLLLAAHEYQLTGLEILAEDHICASFSLTTVAILLSYLYSDGGALSYATTTFDRPTLRTRALCFLLNSSNHQLSLEEVAEGCTVHLSPLAAQHLITEVCSWARRWGTTGEKEIQSVESKYCDISCISISSSSTSCFSSLALV